MTQLQLLAKLLTRKRGVTGMEVIRECRTTSPSKRISEMRALGWTITKHKAAGYNYHIFTGKPPK
jgi:hypothetical protein